jgi:hypothetical protein
MLPVPEELESGIEVRQSEIAGDSFAAFALTGTVFLSLETVLPEAETIRFKENSLRPLLRSIWSLLSKVTSRSKE